MSSTTLTRAPRKDYVPEDYTDLFRNYYGYVTRLVSGCGIDADRAEDVAMTILAKFYEKDALADYDPEFKTSHAVDYARTPGRVAFSTFLSGFVLAYVRHHRDRQTITKRREPVWMDMPFGGSSDYREGRTTWGELNAEPVEQDHGEFECEELVRVIRKHLANLPPLGRLRTPMVDVFDLMLEQVTETGKHDVKAMAEHFGVSQSLVRNWLAVLREEVRKVQEG